MLAQTSENGAPKAPEIFFGGPAEGGQQFSFTPCVFTQNAHMFLETLLHVGPWLLPHPSVTCHSSLEEEGGGVGTRPRYLIVCLWRRRLASRQGGGHHRCCVTS